MKLINNTLFISKREFRILELYILTLRNSEIAFMVDVSPQYIAAIGKLYEKYGLLVNTATNKNSYAKKKYQPTTNPQALRIVVSRNGVSRSFNRCKQCNEKISKKRTFCSLKCKGEYFRGSRSPNWKGGKTFAPYCHRFNSDLKERVRVFFGRRCFLCNKAEDPHDKLRVHHINYNKMACCSEGGAPLFVPLCASCHNKTNRSKNREYWIELFYNKLMEQTGGKCYLTKQEMRDLKQESRRG